MPTRYRARSRRRGSSNRSMWWNIASTAITVSAGGSAVFNMLPLGSLPPALQGGLTILRMIGSLSIVPQVANLNVQFAHGILVMTEVAATAGVVPDPIVDLVDWYYHQQRFVQQAFLDTVYFPFDIRTSRRIRGQDRTLEHTIHNSASSGTGLEYSLSARLLCTRS